MERNSAFEKCYDRFYVERKITAVGSLSLRSLEIATFLRIILSKRLITYHEEADKQLHSFFE